MKLEGLPEFARELLATARVGHVGLIDPRGRPRVLPVTFALADGAAWSAVDQKPKRAEGEELARVRWLRRRPEASLCVDVYDDDWSRLAWLQLTCTATIVPVADGREALDALVAKYEQYREQAPPGPLIRLQPERAVHWHA